MASEMNGYGLVAVIFQSVASLGWPAAFVFAVWLFREKLLELLPKLRVKHKDWELSFMLARAEKEASALAPIPAASPEIEATPEEIDRFEEIAKISPRAAILQVRADLEEVVRRLGQRHQLDKSAKVRTMTDAIRQLRKLNIIDSHTSKILDDLRNVGNRAAHGLDNVEPKYDDAVRFKKLADQVIARIELLS